MFGILLLAASLHAEGAGDVFPAIPLGASVAEVRPLLQERCQELTSVRAETPVFPLAAEVEEHLLCSQYSMPSGAVIGEVAFSFGDDSLGLIEARNGAVAALAPIAGPKVWTFSGYDIYMPARVVSHPARDVVWKMNEGALHAHLFLTPNPHLEAREPTREFDPSAARPSILVFEGSVAELRPVIEAACDITEDQPIKQPWLPSEPQVQLQINCYGYEYAGYPRKIEAVFGDGHLELAWILTGKGEEDRIRKALVDAYGSPLFVSDTVEAFADWQVVLRKDKPEVLMVSKTLAPVYQVQYSGSN